MKNSFDTKAAPALTELSVMQELSEQALKSVNGGYLISPNCDPYAGGYGLGYQFDPYASPCAGGYGLGYQFNPYASPCAGGYGFGYRGGLGFGFRRPY